MTHMQKQQNIRSAGSPRTVKLDSRISMMVLRVHEIFEKAEALETKEEKKEFLGKTHNTLAIRDILRAAFDDTIVFTLPEGAPSFKGDLSSEGMSASDLSHLTTRFTYFVKGGKGDQLNPIRREKMFLEVLESIHPKDSELLIAVKDKKFNTLYPSITKNLVKEIWPRLIAA